MSRGGQKSPLTSLIEGIFITIVGGLLSLFFFSDSILPDNSQQLEFEEQSDVLSNRITQIDAARDDLESLNLEIDRLSVEAARLEQKANEAIALSNLSEDEIKALERRLNKDNNQRDIIFLIAGAALGVIFDRLFYYLTSKLFS